MSPEPTQETSKDLDFEDMNEARIPVITDMEEEDPYDVGYALLSDNPNDNEMVESDEDDDDEDGEWTVPMNSHQNRLNLQENIQSEVPSEVVEVWSSNCNRSNIPLDSEKICQVKSLMASFTLPNSVIPEWASNISEDQWKEELMERINEMQKKTSD